jgi:hypothetical protein
MTQFVGTVGHELAAARGIEDQVSILAVYRRIGNPRGRGANRRLAVRLGGRRRAFDPGRLSIGAGGRKRCSNKKNTDGKPG